MTMTLSSEQIKAMIERLVTILLTLALAKLVRLGWLSESDSAQLLPALVIVPSLVYAWYVNRGQALAQATVNAIPGTLVVTDPKVAEAVPGDNVVSNEAVQVVLKHQQ